MKNTGSPVTFWTRAVALVDYNEIVGSKAPVVMALAETLPALAVGDPVATHDGGDETCLGHVHEIKNGLVYIELDWSTWGYADAATSTRERPA